MALVYSCCFWFSLRLGGILIGVFCLFQGIAFLILCCWAHERSALVKEELSQWVEDINLIHSNEFLEIFLEDPKRYVMLMIVLICVYLITCIIFIYGAYICSNLLMLSFILLELVRLILISALVATVLLLLKENTMDIGSLIGASVIGGFFLLGMFYLWVCAANLPILINEIKHDEQSAIISKLEQLLETNQRTRIGFGNTSYGDISHKPPTQGKGVFFVT